MILKNKSSEQAFQTLITLINLTYYYWCKDIINYLIKQRNGLKKMIKKQRNKTTYSVKVSFSVTCHQYACPRLKYGLFEKKHYPLA